MFCGRSRRQLLTSRRTLIPLFLLAEVKTRLSLGYFYQRCRYWASLAQRDTHPPLQPIIDTAAIWALAVAARSRDDHTDRYYCLLLPLQLLLLALLPTTTGMSITAFYTFCLLVRSIAASCETNVNSRHGLFQLNGSFHWNVYVILYVMIYIFETRLPSADCLD